MLRCFLLLSFGDMRIIYSSPPASSVLGTAQHFLRNLSFFDLLHPEEKELARNDLQSFMESKSLYGSVTKCRVFNYARNDFVVVDAYTNVITENLVYASIFREMDELDTIPAVPLKSGLDEISSIKLALDELAKERPVDDAGIRSADNEHYNTRVLVIYDTPNMVNRISWPPTNFKRLIGVEVWQAEAHVLDETKTTCEYPTEMITFLNDVRSVQKLENTHTKRFCTIHYIRSIHKPLQALESVLDVQDDLTIIISEIRSDHAPRYYEGGSTSEPRRMVPIDTKIGPPSQLVKKVKTCAACGKSESPEWRKGPTGEKTLCNACGLRYSRSMRKKSPSLKKSSAA